ncbi:diacylglycerol kinase family protein [Methanobrevibacter sp.]|uniref:diacylglycerol kinase family protein n=1 Tax=Methanobrevibacter sp. TaxID=66852 RepID=UPI00388D6DD5
MKSLINSFKFAFEGIVNTVRVERNLKIQVLAMISTVILGVLLKINEFEWIACISLFGLIISAEMFNTAFEKTLDYVNEEYDEKIKFIKDAAAGAVLVLSIASAVIGLIIFIPKIF